MYKLPMQTEDSGRFCAATCSQPPGAAHRSTNALERCKNSNRLFSWINLNAARERYPVSAIIVKFLKKVHLTRQLGCHKSFFFLIKYVLNLYLSNKKQWPKCVNKSKDFFIIKIFELDSSKKKKRYFFKIKQ